MEWQPFIEVFESKWFRTGPFFAFIAGISFQDEYKIILEAARLAGDEMVLDLGCGSGIYSRPLARELQHGAVIGLDLSMPMLYYARSRARALGLENLIFVHGNAHRLPFPDNQFAAANSTATIHLFSPAELRDTLKEIHRVLKPGGRLMTSCLRNILPGEPAKRFYDWYSPKVGTYYRRPEDLELFFEEAGFTDIHCHHARRYWQVMSATKRE
jgi:ubiquinone/menaquinone biosynthesis C-methylase UbiE